MGVDTKGITRNKVDYNEVFNFIKQKYDSKSNCNISFNRAFKINMGRIEFEYNGEERSIFISEMESTEEYPEIEIEVGSLWMSLGMWGSSIEIMNTIMKHFGGYVDESDCDDIGWVEYRK